MNNDIFTKLVNKRLDLTKDTLCAKAEEYARGDRLSNFKQVAHLLGSTLEKALLGMVVKHIVATVDFISDIDNGTVQPYERWNEKLGDIIAYMILLDALINERFSECPSNLKS